MISNQGPNFNLLITIHDICLVNSGHPLSSARLSIMEGVTCNSFRCIPCDEFDRLHYAVDDLEFHSIKHLRKEKVSGSTNFVLNTRIFTLRVFTNEDRVHVVVGSFEAFNRHTRSDIGKEIEGPSKGQVQGHMSLANCL
jgi:hypothetical protein